jgi:hypothetical protein
VAVRAACPIASAKEAAAIGRNIMDVDFLCLANSTKHGGRCVAGIRLVEGGWVRPISSQPDGTLSLAQTSVGGEPLKLLDLVHADVGAPCPQPHQPENVVLSKGGFTRTATLTPSQALPWLARNLDRDRHLLGNDWGKVSTGWLTSRPARSSLTLVEPSIQHWCVENSQRGNRQVRCEFSWHGVTYNLSVTDPVWRAKFDGLDFGNYPADVLGGSPLDRTYFVISLGEPYEGYCYKLIAGVVVVFD